jgi:hypothetical protein
MKLKNVVVLTVLLFIEQKAAAQNALTYYRTINSAELAICNKDLPGAFELYEKAFRINPNKPFSRDLLNGYYCALDTRHYKAAEHYLKLLLQRGIRHWSLKHFVRAKYTGADLERINAWLATYPNDTNRSDQLYAQLQAIHLRDQATRAWFSEMNDGKYMVDSVHRMDKLHGDSLAMIFRKYGVPNELKCGLMNGNPLLGPAYYLVAYHYAGGYTAHLASHALDTFLFKAIFTYDFHPIEFIKIFAISEINVTGLPFRYKKYTLQLPMTIDYIYVWENEKAYPEYLPADVEKRMNAERAGIGLDSLDELRRKLDFAQRNKKDSTYSKYFLDNSFGKALDAETYEQAKSEVEKFEQYKRG